MTENLKLFKRFTVTCLLILCVTSLVCGIALVAENTRYLALGETGRQVGITLDRETTTILAGARRVTLPTLSPALQWARFAPAPVGTVVMLIVNLHSLAAD